MTTNATPTTVSTTTSTDTAAAETPATTTEQPAAPAKTQEPCRLCGLVGKHELPEQPATCVICSKTHGVIVKREIPRGADRKLKLVERNVAVRHSLLALRQGGLKDDGIHFVNPAAPWETQPACDDCAYELVRGISKARKELFESGAKRHEVDERLPYPRMFALSVQIDWVERENRREATQRERLAQKRAENEAARAEDRARRERIAQLIAKGARPHRSGNERAGSVPPLPTVPDRTAKNGGRRNDRGNGNRGGHVAEVEPASDSEVQEYLAAQAQA